MSAARLAVSLLAAVLGAAACEPAPPPPVSLAAMSAERGPAPADGGAPAPPGRCPQDAPWNGKVCLGMGYVACPGADRMDDAGACASPPRDGGADH